MTTQITSATADNTALTQEQRARAEAVRVATRALAKKTGPFVFEASDDDWSVVKLAEYVLTGVHPALEPLDPEVAAAVAAEVAKADPS